MPHPSTANILKSFVRRLPNSTEALGGRVQSDSGSMGAKSERIFGLPATLLMSVKRRLPMNMTRKVSALLLGVITFAVAIGGTNTTALAQPTGLSAPIQGS